jgi:uncharacterized membrane-anchored protein
MRIPSLRRTRETELPGITGPARLDRRTKNLSKRLRPGDIALIDHVDLDRISAETLADRQVAAVVNVAESISGRYPNLGPEILVGAGIPLVDGVGADILRLVSEGDVIRIDDGIVYLGDTSVAAGQVQDRESIATAMEAARAGLSAQLEAFTANTMEYLRRERDLLLDGVGVPDVETNLDGRQVLIVVPGYDFQEDLRTLRHYIREYRPVLIGVDGGADALVEAGYTPDLIVGDMDSVSDPTLRCGAEIVVRAYRDGRVPGLDRLERLGVKSVLFPASGTSEDVAMLLADSKGASLIVAVGTHATLVEFLDRGRSGMASTFLTRLRVGPKLVDAKSVGRLYQSRIRSWQLVMLVVAGLIAVIVAVAATPTGQDWLEVLDARFDDFASWLRGQFQ